MKERIDAFGNRISKTVVDTGSVIQENYSYDAVNRLTLWESGSDTRSYSYDLRGNLVQTETTGSGALMMNQLLQDPEAIVEESIVLPDPMTEPVADGQDGEGVTSVVYDKQQADDIIVDGLDELELDIAAFNVTQPLVETYGGMMPIV